MITFTILGLIVLCVAALYLGIYILPFWAGILVFKGMERTDIDTIALSIIVGIVVYGLLRLILDRIRSRTALRLFVAIVILPVIWAGYTGALDVLHGVLPSPLFRQGIALPVGMLCGFLALAKLNTLYRPRHLYDRQKPLEAEVDPSPTSAAPTGLGHRKLLDGPRTIDFGAFRKR